MGDVPMIKVQTTCGKEFEISIEWMKDWQLRDLLAQNADRLDIEPRQIAALRAELERRGAAQ